MNHLRPLPLLLACLGALTTTLRAQAPAGILEALRAADAVTLGRFTLELEVQAPANGFLLDHGIQRRSTILSADGASRALDSRLTLPAAPAYRPPASEEEEALDYDELGNRILWQLRARQTLIEGPVNDTFEESECVHVDPEGRVLERAVSAQLFLYAPGDDQNRWEFERSCWALGRGFSPHLDRLLERTDLAGGLVRVRAEGTYGPHLRGIWELDLDLDHGLLVRSAAFRVPGSERPAVRCATQGQAPAGSPSFAETGAVLYPLADGRTLEYRARFVRRSAAPDAALFASLREKLGRDASPEAHWEVLDYRDDPARPQWLR